MSQFSLFKKTSLIASLVCMIFLFQNCAENFDPDAFSDTSSFLSEPRISNQSSSMEFNENESYYLFIEVSNLSDYTIEWAKDGELIEGASSLTLEFDQAQMTDAGSYQAIIRTNSLEIRSEVIQVIVNRDMSVETITDPVIQFQGQSYAVHAPTGSQPSQIENRERIANAYCQSRFGETAVSTSSAAVVEQELILFGRLVDQNQCVPYSIIEPELGIFEEHTPRGYVSGFCLWVPDPFFGNLVYTRLSQVVCRL